LVSLFAFVFAIAVSLPGVSHAASADPGPTNEDFAMMVLANQSRSDPAGDRVSSPPVPPLAWTDDLATATRLWLGKCATGSCTGDLWKSLVDKYYAPGSAFVQSNVGGYGSSPEMAHLGLMGSPPHRDAILNGAYREVGIATVDQYGVREDFSFGETVPLPPIPAGTVLPRIGDDGEPRKLLVNYYDASGARPNGVWALVGSSCVSLPLLRGKPGHGTYGITQAFSGDGCIPLVFEAITADGSRERWPSDEAVLVGVGSSGVACDERTTDVPVQDCGGSLPTPTPTPGPTPTPDPTSSGPDSRLSNILVSLRAGKARSVGGRVHIEATLDVPSSFDPSSTTVQLAMQYGAGGVWSETLPMLCGEAPCLELNGKGTKYQARYGTPGPTLTFSRKRGGRWRMVYWSGVATFDPVASGPIALTLNVDGLQLAGTVKGKLQQRSLTGK
jgi:hypothetical protein